MATAKPRILCPIRLYREHDSWGQALVRIIVCMRMWLRMLVVAITSGPMSARSWTKNALRFQRDPSLKGFYSCIKQESEIVSGTVRELVKRHFADSNSLHPFSQKGQTISYVHDFNPELLRELEKIYSQVLQTVNERDPTLRLHPIKKTFAERIYVINYPGPEVQLAFHYDCNDEHDFKCQVVLEKSEGAPSLSCIAEATTKRTREEGGQEEVVFEEDPKNICLFHPHSTYHGIRRGTGSRMVLMFTYTRLVDDHRPIVCHADLISRRWLA